MTPDTIVQTKFGPVAICFSDERNAFVDANSNGWRLTWRQRPYGVWLHVVRYSDGEWHPRRRHNANQYTHCWSCHKHMDTKDFLSGKCNTCSSPIPESSDAFHISRSGEYGEKIGRTVKDQLKEAMVSAVRQLVADKPDLLDMAQRDALEYELRKCNAEIDGLTRSLAEVQRERDRIQVELSPFLRAIKESLV